jgi:hypothetical protein
VSFELQSKPQLSFETVKVYGVFSKQVVEVCVKPVEMCMKNCESKKRLQALQRFKFLSIEIQDALRFAIQKLSNAEYHDAQISKPVMANKRWSQAEENQPVESLLAGNSIELIATNLSRSTNSVFSRLLHLGIISINSSKEIDLLKAESRIMEQLSCTSNRGRFKEPKHIWS